MVEIGIHLIALIAIAAIAGGGLAVVLFALINIAGREDRDARHTQHMINPFDDVTITRPGEE